MAAAFFLSFASAAPAIADIAGYNAAIRKGDAKAASEAAVEVWAGWDRSSPDTALMAREFGFAALAAGLNERAAEFGGFLVREGASLKTPDDQPATSLVLLRAAELRLKTSDKTRDTLRQALFARNAAPGVDMTSVLAWELLYMSDWTASTWEESSKAATAAAEYLQRAGDVHAGRVSNAEVQAAAAAFMAGRVRQTNSRNDHYTRMADAHDRVIDRIDASTTPAARRTHWDAKWQAEAWAIAIESYLTSTYAQTGSLLNNKLQPRELKEPGAGQNPGSGTPESFCSGDLKGPKITYPASKTYSGMVGSVIMRVTTDNTGKVTSVTELASIPSRGFAEGVRKSLSASRYVADSSAAAGCTLQNDDLVYRVMFYLG